MWEPDTFAAEFLKRTFRTRSFSIRWRSPPPPLSYCTHTRCSEDTKRKLSRPRHSAVPVAGEFFARETRGSCEQTCLKLGGFHQGGGFRRFRVRPRTGMALPASIRSFMIHTHYPCPSTVPMSTPSKNRS